MQRVQGGRILAARHQAAPPKVPARRAAPRPADAEAGTVKANDRPTLRMRAPTGLPGTGPARPGPASIGTSRKQERAMRCIDGTARRTHQMYSFSPVSLTTRRAERAEPMRIPAYDMISRISRMNGRMPFLPPSSSMTAPDSVTSEPDNLLAATSPAAPARDVIAEGPMHARTHTRRAEPSRAEPSRARSRTALDIGSVREQDARRREEQ